MRLPWPLAVACLCVGVVLAQAGEWWYDTRVAPTLPQATCPNYDTLTVPVNEWRLGSPRRVITPNCEDGNE